MVIIFYVNYSIVVLGRAESLNLAAMNNASVFVIMCGFLSSSLSLWTMANKRKNTEWLWQNEKLAESSDWKLFILWLALTERTFCINVSGLGLWDWETIKGGSVQICSMSDCRSIFSLFCLSHAPLSLLCVLHCSIYAVGSCWSSDFAEQDKVLLLNVFFAGNHS